MDPMARAAAARCSHALRGKELNSPNDVIVHSSGAIYFSDPTYGRMPVFGIEREQDLDFQGVYRLAPEGGDPQLLVDDFVQPNGLCFSPDESLLYINDTDRAHIRVFDVGGDGTISNGRVLADGIGTGDLESGELVDGMKCDEHGNVWVTGRRASGSSHRTASISASSRSPRTSATSTGAARTGAGCSYRRRHPSTGSRQDTRPPRAVHELRGEMSENESVSIDRNRAVLLIQDMQNDVMMEAAPSRIPARRAREGAKRRRELPPARRGLPRCRIP
jgi:gluconolactonase